MQEMFGNVWVTMFKEVPNQTWIDALSQLTEKDINRGLNAILRDSLDYPPNLPKFLKLCTAPVVEDVYEGERNAKKLIAALPNYQCSDAVKNSALAEIKKMLRFNPQS